MADFVELIEQLVGKRALMETPPAPASEPKTTYADVTKARELLGYDPCVTVEEGLARFWTWYQAAFLS
jgi:UDP-glucuronate 4-epimerase